MLFFPLCASLHSERTCVVMSAFRPREKKRRTPTWFLGVIALSSLLNVAVPSLCQESSALPVEAVLGMRKRPGFREIALSPDGSWLAYLSCDRKKLKPKALDDLAEFNRTGISGTVAGCDLLVLDRQSRREQNLTAGQAMAWLPVWSPDGDFLAFLSNRGASRRTRLWVWERRTGNLHLGADLDVRSNQIEWTPDSQAVVVGVIPEGMNLDDFVATTTGE